ncbi:hypothetical protein [Bradyrhizobium sp. LHD-71]|uniref:hypothetical protein n=1 Tax=Bradyrhizobium sp. LHD-71 TaxID=3072141 RepID=UPI00280E2652|nr:hypothetical protein [Bradyrhizobium sp. LHD-71]MDQ8730093.1 hypothetical protein [Bradyrhizobium sp. LHD-71]
MQKRQKHNPNDFDASSDWLHRKVSVMQAVGQGPKKAAESDCWEKFSEAANVVAALPASTVDELRMKAMTCLRLDNKNRSIARSVAADLVTLSKPFA